MDTHRLYDAHLPLWQKLRDCVAGEDVVKARGDAYLPRLTAQTEEAYRAYVNRALFYGATGRTVQGLLGAIMRKDPQVVAPAAAAPLLANVTGAGGDLGAFTRAVVAEQLVTGRAGVLVDVGARGGLPYLRLYEAETILDWHERHDDGRPVLDRVVLAEHVDDEVRYRTLLLDDAGRYVQTVTGENDDDLDIIVPTRLGAPLRFIPFVFVGGSNDEARPNKPPLLDLANVNLSHYRSSADLEHGRHFTALPTPYIVGADPDEDITEPLLIGSGAAWLLPAGAQPGLLEFNGQGLKHLENALVEKQELMVQLGARMLETQKRSAETSEALRLRQAGDSSVLYIVSDTASRGLTQAVRWLVDWAGVPGEVRVRLNTDFFETRMGPSELRALVEAWQEGALGFSDLYAQLVRGEVVDPHRTPEDIRSEVITDAEAPTG